MRLGTLLGTTMIAVALWLLLGASIFCQALPEPSAPSVAANPLWSWELPYPHKKGEVFDFALRECTGDGVRDALVLALPERGIGQPDMEAICLDGATGAERWRTPVLNITLVMRPQWTDRHLFVTPGGDSQTVIDLRTGKVRKGVPLLLRKRCLSVLFLYSKAWEWGEEVLALSFCPQTKEVQQATYLRFPLAPEAPPAVFSLDAWCPAAFSAGCAVLNTPEGLVCLDRNNGAALWRVPAKKKERCVFLSADEVGVVAGRTEPGRLSLLAAESGAELWSRPLFGTLNDYRLICAQPILTREHIVNYQGIGQGVEVRVRATGERVWETRASTPCWILPVGEGAFGLREDLRFRVFQLQSKIPLLDSPLKKVESLQPEGGGTLFFASRPNDRLMAFDTRSLRVAWEKEVPLVRGILSVPTLLLCDRDGEHLIAFYRQNAAFLNGRTGADLGQIPYERWKALWPLSNYSKFLQYLGGTQLSCLSAEESFRSGATLERRQKLALRFDGTRALALDDRTFRMLPAPCTQEEEPEKDALLGYMAELREVSEYLSTWLP